MNGLTNNKGKQYKPSNTVVDNAIIWRAANIGSLIMEWLLDIKKEFDNHIQSSSSEDVAIWYGLPTGTRVSKIFAEESKSYLMSKWPDFAIKVSNQLMSNRGYNETIRDLFNPAMEADDLPWSLAIEDISVLQTILKECNRLSNVVIENIPFIQDPIFIRTLLNRHTSPLIWFWGLKWWNYLDLKKNTDNPNELTLSICSVKRALREEQINIVAKVTWNNE